MRILMLGNSFSFVNEMPAMLARLTGAEVAWHTRGGARLAEQLNPKTKLGAKTLAALEREAWDYVVLAGDEQRADHVEGGIFEECGAAVSDDPGGGRGAGAVCHLGV